MNFLSDACVTIADKKFAMVALCFFTAASLRSAELSTNSPVGEQNWNWHVQNTDIVQGYREGRMSLVEMIRDINTHVVQTITTLVHTQAEAMESLEVIDDKAIASLPATLLYLGDPWRSLIAAFRREHPLPSLRLTAETEERVLTAGQTAIFGIWNALGWTIREWPVRQWEVIVGDPKRLV